MSSRFERRTAFAIAPRRLVIRARFALATLLAVSFANSASNAYAVCGDHVVTKEMRELMAKVMPESKEAPVVPVLPCRGPGCRQTPMDSPITPVPVSDGIGKPAVWLFSKLSLPRSQSLASGEVSSDQPLEGYRADLFRPPEFLV